MSLRNFPKITKQITELDTNSGCLAPTAMILKFLCSAFNSANVFGLMHSFAPFTFCFLLMPVYPRHAFRIASWYSFKKPAHLEFIHVYGRPAGKRWQERMSYISLSREGQLEMQLEKVVGNGAIDEPVLLVVNSRAKPSCYHKRVILKHATCWRAFCHQAMCQSQKK